MAIEIVMPVLSAGMEEATLARWLKAEGDRVAVGDVLAEVETDKATMEMEAEAAGILGKRLVADGTAGVPVNSPIAILLAEGESLPADAGTAAPAAPVAVVEAAPAVVVPAPATTGTDRVLSSPLARRLASRYGVDLSGLTGSGPKGRVVRLDVERAREAGPSAVPTPASVAAPAPAAKAAPIAAAVPLDRPHVALPNSSMRKTIARRLTESKQTVPHFYLTVDVELDALLALRKDLNGRPNADYRLSVNDFIVKAVALALRQVPAANASWTDEAIIQWSDVDVCVAVATDGGLLTPIVAKADQLGLATLSNRVKDLAARARDGGLKPEEFQGGGFTISNLGMYGITAFSAIVNPPQACILAVGAAEERAVVRDGALAVRTMMTCTLSVDHRAVDGAVGAAFLAAFKPLLEDPLRLML
jgi:pyruvate dehydrogenase E2 component (dihydrolipoamide acetyltransferase)